MSWSSHTLSSSSKRNLLRFCNHDSIVHSKVASFDLDSTLIHTKSGRSPYLRLDGDDWVFAVDTLKMGLQLLSRTHNVVVFSNQGQIKGAHDGKSAAKFKGVIENMTREFGIPWQVYAATQIDSCRKGVGISMWDFYMKDFKNVKVDRENSFFVGDAAGRPDDFSDSDKMFAMSAKLIFFDNDYFYSQILNRM